MARRHLYSCACYCGSSITWKSNPQSLAAFALLVTPDLRAPMVSVLLLPPFQLCRVCVLQQDKRRRLAGGQRRTGVAAERGSGDG